MTITIDINSAYELKSMFAHYGVAISMFSAQYLFDNPEIIADMDFKNGLQCCYEYSDAEEAETALDVNDFLYEYSEYGSTIEEIIENCGDGGMYYVSQTPQVILVFE